MSLEWDTAELQIIGERQNQEDYSRIISEGGNLLCLLADGMGGHAAGEFAAKLAVDDFIETALGEGFPWSNAFINALNAANSAIADDIRENPDRDGMGCTLIGAELSKDSFIRWISVGDSRLFHFSSGELTRINADHSMAGQLEAMVKRGELTEEQALRDPSRHMLLSAVTGEPISRMDYKPGGRLIKAGDIIILASDGIDTLEPDEISEKLQKFSGWRAADIGRSLISAVVKRGSPRQDNTTLVVVRVTDGGYSQG